MEDITTPKQVIDELNRLMAESQKGVQALYEAEIKVAELENEYDKTISSALLSSDGTIPERQAKAKLAASEIKLELDIAKAQLSRVKMKLKTLDSAQMATSVIARQVDLQWRHA
jgi:rRNA-processing protein FCF1